MGYRNDRFAAANAVFVASTTLRAGIIHSFSTASGNISQPLPAASTFGASQAFYVRKDGGNGILTVTPAGADTINGRAASIVVYEGQSVLFVRGLGTDWQTFDAALGGSAPAMSFLDDGSTLDIYLDPVNGSDSNTGISVGSPLLTLQEVYRRFPWQMFNNSRALINLLNATSTPVTCTVDQIFLGNGNRAFDATYAFRAPAMVPYTPATGPSTAALDATPCTRVDQTQAASGTGNRTSFNFTTAAPGWTVNDLAGSFIRVVRGGTTLVLYELPITENTATAVYVDSINVVGVVLSTDVATIVRPAVRFEAPLVGGFRFLNITGRGQSEASQGISNYATFERVGFGANLYVSIQGLVTYDRVQLENSAQAHEFLAGFHGFANCASQGGIRFFGATSSAVRRPETGQVNTTAITDMMIAPRTGQTCAGLELGGPRASAQPRNASVYTHSAPLSVYRASGSSHGILVNGNNAFFGSFGSVALGGRGSAGLGLKCGQGGRARIAGGTLTTITGTGGDLAVATGAAVTYGVAAGNFQEVAGWNGNLIRLALTATTAVGDPSIITTASMTI